MTQSWVERRAPVDVDAEAHAPRRLLHLSSAAPSAAPGDEKAAISPSPRRFGMQPE